MARRVIDRNCAVCRFMRGMTYSSLGGGVGALIAWVLGASHTNVMLTAIVMAAIFAFGLANRDRKK